MTAILLCLRGYLNAHPWPSFSNANNGNIFYDIEDYIVSVFVEITEKRAPSNFFNFKTRMNDFL